MAEIINKDWWSDPRCHFGILNENDPMLTQREDIKPAINFISTALSLSSSARILDLCCGPGRYSIELAHKGFTVVGIDLNDDYIALARKISKDEKVSVEFLVGAMREVPFENYFDAIINVTTSFGYFDDENDNQGVIQAIAKALKKNGIFLLEMANRDYLLKNFLSKDWDKFENNRIKLTEREFDYIRGRINSNFEILNNDGTKERFAHSWRAYTLVELVSILNNYGLSISNVYGDWMCNKYSVDSQRVVVVCKK